MPPLCLPRPRAVVGMRGGSRWAAGRPRVQGFQLMFKHSDRACPSGIVTGQVGEAGPGASGATSPAPGVSPRRVPRIVGHLLLVVAVTLSESVGWRPSSPPNRPHRVRQRGRGPACRDAGIYRDVYPNKATVARNCSPTGSLLHLAPTAHSSRDHKEVTPCHPGHNRPDHHPHRR